MLILGPNDNVDGTLLGTVVGPMVTEPSVVLEALLSDPDWDTLISPLLGTEAPDDEETSSVA
jgi:hypothetical protein